MVTLKINGEDHTVDVPPDMPLLWVLRDVVGLTGTKFGCGMALCGACTVHVNGEAARSCVTPISSVVGKEIITVEGYQPIPAILCSGRGLRRMCPNAATATRGRLCRRRCSWRKIPNRATPILTMQCPAIFVVSGRINASVARFIVRRQ